MNPSCPGRGNSGCNGPDPKTNPMTGEPLDPNHWVYLW